MAHKRLCSGPEEHLSQVRGSVQTVLLGANKTHLHCAAEALHERGR